MDCVQCLFLSRTTASFQFKVFVAERKGERDEMQDSHQTVDDLLEHFKGPVSPSV